MGLGPTDAGYGIEEFEGHVPSTLNTTPIEAIPDSALRRAKLVQGMLPDWGGKRYEGDTLPRTLEKKQVQHCHKRYRVLKEEFYTKTQRQVVTPQNCMTFLKVHRRWAALNGANLSWDLSEQWSCTARLSAHAFRRGLNVGFPIDYRYGWDLNNSAHRRLIDEVNATFKPSVICSAPDCRLYSKARKGVDAIVESEDKAKESRC